MMIAGDAIAADPSDQNADGNTKTSGSGPPGWRRVSARSDV